MTALTDFPGIAAPLLPRDAQSLSALDLSDRGNAARFVARHGERFLFVRAQGWFVYTGTHWSREGADQAAIEAAGATVASILDEAKALEDAAKRDITGAEALIKRAGKLRAWSTAAGSVNRIKGLLSLAEAKLAATLDEFDRDPYALNVQNGTLRFYEAKWPDGRLDWRVRLDPHAAADRITRICAFPYHASEEAPRWEDQAPAWAAHLERMVPDWNERMFLRRMMGYCALGLTREQVFFMLQGRGGDGKSVTVNTVRRVLGAYSTTADVKTFLDMKGQQSGAAASPDMARLAGATRLVSTSEPPRGARLNEGLIKQVTGGAPLLARHLNRDPFEFIPRFKIILEVNARPVIGGSDDGIWRRVVPMLWRIQLKREEMDPNTEARIVEQGAGVLNWIVRGACDYLVVGLGPPATVEEALADYKRSSNILGEWMAECLERDAEAVELMADLYQSYKDFCERNGYEPMSQKALGQALGDQQITMTSREPSAKRRARRKGARLLTDRERDRSGYADERD